MPMTWLLLQRRFSMSDNDDHDHDHFHQPHELGMPHEVMHDPKAREVMRAWIINGGLSLSLHGMAFGKAETWGHVLAGIAQQVAGACAEMGKGTAAGNLEDIRKVLLADLESVVANSPT